MGARRVIGLTGDVGSGKSTVLQWLADRGAATRDADAATHAVLAGDGDAVAAVGRRFGPGVLAGGVVDRAALAAAVFDDPEALRDLEAIVHPAVIRALTTWLAGVSAPVAVVEAVKLVEAGLDRTVVGAVWLVTCAPEVRRERLVARGWSADEAARRMAAGTPLAPRLARAAVVIDNSGPWPATERQLAVAWQRLRDSGGDDA